MSLLASRGLYVITDCQRLEYDEVLNRTEQALNGGIVALQYRDKNAGADTRARMAVRLHDLCSRYETPLIINDDIGLAQEIKAEGIHLGRDDMRCTKAREFMGESVIIGISCYNSLNNAVMAQAEGADYAAFGAFFPTSSKQDTVPATLELLKQAKKELTIPIAAIGGITLENCPDILAAGADLIAVINSVYASDDPYGTVVRFNELFRGSALV